MQREIVINGWRYQSTRHQLRKCQAMRFGRTFLGLVLTLATSGFGFALTRHHSNQSSPKLLHKQSKNKALSRSKGQRTIDDARAEQIQASLIKSGYLSGEVTGHWDSQTEAAMARYQGDNGWQTKLVPDSRAIIKLGLGPPQTSTSKAHPSGFMAEPGASAKLPPIENQ